MPSVDSDTSVSPSGDDSTPHVDSDSTPRTVDSPAENTPIAREFTEERFYEMITDRYFHDARFQNADGSLNSNAVPSARAIARLARNRWIAAGNAAGGVLPTVDVSGHIFPSETIIETAFRDITEATERARMVEADMLRRAFDGRREGLERRGTDDLRDSLREPGRRIFELATRR